MLNETITSNIIPGGINSSTQVGGVLITSNLTAGPVVTSNLTAGVGLTGATGTAGVAGVTGPTGPTGPTGATGTVGTNGVGVPLGGTTNQILAKIDATNYNTQWVNPSVGTGTVTNVSSADANATVATPTTTPVITVVSAPKLLTARTINGVSFDGTANITVADATKEPIITAGTITQYLRGDKTFQTLNQDAVPSGTTNKAYTATEQTKLAGVATGATANSTDTFLLSRTNHTGTQAESTVTNLTTDLAATEKSANKGAVSGYAGLDSGGKVPSAQLPALVINQTYVVASQVAMLALAGDVGDTAIRTDLSQTFILQTLPASTLANWQQLLSPTSPVASVAGKTGAVTLVEGDIASLVTDLAGKQPSGSYLTTLTGDVTSVGNATTLASTTVTPGSYTLSSVTVDAKGRITTISNGATGAIADATTTSKGAVQLAGDLAGTAALPTVPALTSKYSASNPPPYPVTTVAGRTGAIVLAEADITSLTTDLAAKQTIANEDATGGYAGLTLFKINFKNAANTFTNFLTNATTAARTYTFPDKDITVAGLVDITGVNSGTNTGDNSANTLYSGLVTNATHSGDATGATALTLATVNANIGSFGSATQVPTYTVNGKGLTTAAANIAIQIAESQVTSLVTDLAAKQATISLTTTGTSGAATLVGATLNIPSYAGGGGGGITFSAIVASQSAVVNAGYLTNAGTLIILTLPTTAAVGSVIEIAGMGAGGWKIAQNALGVIHFGNKNTTAGVGGSLASSLKFDTLRLVCSVANNEWVVLGAVGNLVVV